MARITPREIIETAKAAGLEYNIVCGELQVTGTSPVLIPFRAAVIEAGARYIGQFSKAAAMVDTRTVPRTYRFKYVY